MDISQLQQLMQLQADPTDIQPVIDGLAQKLAGNSAVTIAEAASTLQSMGIDHQLYLPISRQAMRNQRELARLRIEEANAEQERQHKQELHDLEVAGLRAQLARLQTSQTSQQAQPVTP